MPFGYLDHCPKCGSERGPGGHCCYADDVTPPCGGRQETEEERVTGIARAAEWAKEWNRQCAEELELKERLKQRKANDARSEND